MALGKSRARHLSAAVGDYELRDGRGEGGDMGGEVVCVQVHGDAAMTSQGINQETLQLSRLPHFDVGGSVHFVVNNQVGFTTPSDRGRSSRYCTDYAKQVGAPVIRVNGDSPEVRACVRGKEWERPEGGQ